MSKPQLVNVWTDPTPGAGAFSPMATSLLWLPDDCQIGHPLPAFIFLHGWGGYPHDSTPKLFGPELAAHGYAFLSLCLRRRGMEGQLASMPDDDLRDIQVAVDFLHTKGWQDIFLLGEELGALSAIRYQSKHKDMRVKGIALLNPADEPMSWLKNTIGDAAYQGAVQQAAIAARQGAGMDYRIDLFPDNAPPVTQQASAFLGWWGPAADTLWHSIAQVRTPKILLSSSEHPVPESLTPHAKNIEQACGSGQETIAQLDIWAMQNGARKLAAVSSELVEIDSTGETLYGFLWQQDDKKPEVAILLMHGLTGSPSSPLFGKMAPVLAQYELAVLAIESHRSGWAGHESARLEQDTSDIDNWIAFLINRGYKKIVLAGASMGSMSIGRYQAVKQHPDVVGLAHLMPTADGAAWFEQAAGSGAYAQAVADAQQAIEKGTGDSELIDVDVRQPPPSVSQGRFRWTQRAASWLSWWGPEADSNNTQHFANAHIPLLLISGTTDSYNDKARFAQIRSAAINAPSVDEIWYQDIDHGLAGVERQVADDIGEWLKKLGIIKQ